MAAKYEFFAASRTKIFAAAPDRQSLQRGLDEFHRANPGQQAYIFSRDTLPRNYSLEDIYVDKTRRSRRRGRKNSPKARVPEADRETDRDRGRS